MNTVQTVTGPRTPDELGITQMHEHLISDFRVYLPAPGDEEADGFAAEPLRLSNLYELKTRLLNEEVLHVDEFGVAVEEVSAFAHHGGRTIVDSTSIGIGRDPLALAELSARTGVNVVMGAGWYVAESISAADAHRGVESMAEQIETELTVGVGDTGVRAGLIGEVGLSWPHHPVEERSLRAACRAQQRTDVALQIHPGRDPRSPFAAMELVQRAGGNPERTVMCHVERTLTEAADMIELAATGCMLEFDLFGQESSYYFVPGFTGMPNDAGRVGFIRALMDAGFADRILLSQDICTRVHLTRYGGEGLHHLLHRVVPLMERVGMTGVEIDQLLVRNPARVLAGAEPTAVPAPSPLSSSWSRS